MTKPKKRRPGKSPDFVARDTGGVWHIIECKGTQTAGGYRERQLGDAGPPASGAVSQKRTITFPAGYSGQRLACGLYIGVQGGSDASSLRVIDPPGREDFVINENEIVLAEDAMTRAVGARSLRFAGFGATSSAMSAPAGTDPASRRLVGRRERLRQEAIEAKRARAVKELKNRTERNAFTADGERYLGREVELDLPASVIVGRRRVRSVRIRCGIDVHFLDELGQYALVEEPLQEMVKIVQGVAPRTKLDADRYRARLYVGSSFVSEINLY